MPRDESIIPDEVSSELIFQMRVFVPELVTDGVYRDVRLVVKAKMPGSLQCVSRVIMDITALAWILH